MDGTSQLSQTDLARLSETFRLLGDPSRLRILIQCLDGPKFVTEMADQLDLSQSLVSHHLRLLRDARLVLGERHARQVFYSVADAHIVEILLGMIDHIDEDPPIGKENVEPDV